MAEHDLTPASDGRFDAEATQRIVALAGWLQVRQLEHLSRDQLNEIAAEVGIEPRFIDASIQALQESQVSAVRHATKLGWLQQAAGNIRERWRSLVRRPESRPFVRAGSLAVAAWIVAGLGWFFPLPVQILIWIALAFTVLFEAWQARGFRRGLLTTLTAHLSFVILLLLTGLLTPASEGGMIVAISTLIPSLLIGGIAGAIGYGVAQSQEQRQLEDRQEMLRRFYQLHDHLHSGAQRWTYLAVDVAGSTALKSGADALAVEYTFAEFHRYVAHHVAAHGGRIHSASGDGTIAMFADERSAVAAAETMQRGMLSFNQARNRLGRSLVIRAGIHSGLVVAPGGDPAQVQFSEVLDHTSHLQQAAPPGGVAISHEALTRVGPLPGAAALADPVDGQSAYAWIPGAPAPALSAPPPAAPGPELPAAPSPPAAPAP